MKKGSILDRARLAVSEDRPELQKSASSSLEYLFRGYEDQIARALPKSSGFDAARIIVIASTVIASDPKLRKCEPDSVLAALMQTVIMGLSPLPQMGEAYFIPRWSGKAQATLCTFEIGYLGRVALYYRSGVVRSVEARVVYQNDIFSYRYGLEPILTHVPTEGERGPLTYAYARLELMTGGRLFNVLRHDEIERLRLRNPEQEAGSPSWAWATDYEAMAKGKALKSLRPFVPSSGPDAQILSQYVANEDRAVRLSDLAPEGTGVIAPTDWIEDGPEPLDAPEESSDEEEALPAENAIPITEQQIKRFHAIASASGWSKGERDFLLEMHGLESSKFIPADKYEVIVAELKTPEKLDEVRNGIVREVEQA